MAFEVRDVSLALYNLGVVLSGGWVATQLDGLVDPPVLGAMALLSVGWTLYFKFSMAPRLAQLDARSGRRQSDGE